MAIPTSEAHEVATQAGEGVPAVPRSIFGGHEQVDQDGTHSVQAQSLPQPPHKSLDPGEPKEPGVENTGDLRDDAQPIPSVQLEQTPESKPATDGAEHTAIVDSSIVASSKANDGAIKDATSTNTESSRDIDTHTVVEDRPAQVTSKNSVQTQGEDNDNWLDNWDLVVRRCVHLHCDRAFGTQQRLQDHLRRQHAPGSEPLELYRAPDRAGTVKLFNSGPPLVKIVEHGDLVLDVQLDSGVFCPHKRFQVVSQALWAASPVFHAMFGPTSNFQERANIRRANVYGHPPSVISLQDDPNALECLLNVLFHRRSSLAKKYTFADLLNIAIVTDKYGMQDVMAGWAEQLLPLVETWAKEPGHENVLFISWVFGYDAVFEDMCTTLTLTSQIANSRFFLPPPAVALSEHTPSVVIEKLVDVRYKRVQDMRKVIKNHHAFYVLNTHKRLSFCNLSGAGQQQDICNAIQIGHFIQTYNKEKLKTETFWSQRVYDIASRLLAIKPMTFPDGIMDLPSKKSDYPHILTKKPKNAHAGCSWVNEVVVAANEAQLPFETYTIRLSDFPSRQRA